MRRHSKESYLEFKASIHKRDGKVWKPRLTKVFDNGKLQCFKVYEHKKTKFKEEVDLMKMSRFGKSTKHKHCIEVVVKSGLFSEKKHKFKFKESQIDEDYVSLMKLLDHFSIIKLAKESKEFEAQRDSIESTSMMVMRENSVTLGDLQRARLEMNECPKGKKPPNFEFPDFQGMISILKDLHYLFKSKSYVTAGEIRSGIKISSQIREDCLVYICHYISVFGGKEDGEHFILCLDLIWECMKFESFFEIFISKTTNDEMPVSIQRSFSSTSTTSDDSNDSKSSKEKKGKNQSKECQQRFEICVFAAMRSALSQHIKNRLSFLREEAEDPKGFAFYFKKYDAHFFGKRHSKKSKTSKVTASSKSNVADHGVVEQEVSITEHEELCSVYAVHDVFKMVQRLKRCHDTIYRRTLCEFFEIENVHCIVSDAVMNPVVQFVDDFRDELDAVMNGNGNGGDGVFGYRQIEQMASEIYWIYDYLLENTSPKSPNHSNAVALCHSKRSKVALLRIMALPVGIEKSEVTRFEVLSESEHGSTSQSVSESVNVDDGVDLKEEHRNWLRLKRMNAMEPMTRYFIGSLSSSLEMVSRAILEDEFVAKKMKNGILHSTSSVDVVVVIEERVNAILQYELKPMQILELTEMMTSIMIRFVMMISEKTKEEIQSALIALKPLQIENGRNPKNKMRRISQFLNLKQFRRRSSGRRSSNRRQSRAQQEATGDVIGERLLVMIGNLSFIRSLFDGLQSEWNLHRRYAESAEISSWWTSSEKSNILRRVTNYRISNVAEPQMDAETVDLMLQSDKFYDAVYEAMEEAAQQFADKLSASIMEQMDGAIEWVSGDSMYGEEATHCHDLKENVLFNLTTIQIAFDEIPSEIDEFQKVLVTAFWSHYFLGIERRFLIPQRVDEVMSMNGILFLSDLLRDVENLLSEFGVISAEELSNRKYSDFQELSRIQKRIVWALTNTTKIIEVFTERMKMAEDKIDNDESTEDGIDGNVIRMDLFDRNPTEQCIESKTLWLMIKHRAEIGKDAEAALFVKEHKTTGGMSAEDKIRGKLQNWKAAMKKKKNSLEGMWRSSSAFSVSKE